MKPSRREASPYPKADPVLRGLARAADLCLALALRGAGDTAGPLLAALYLAFADGLIDGQSIGKRIFGVRAVVLPPPGVPRGVPAGYRESLLRNAPFALLGLLSGPTHVGEILLLAVGVPLLAVEVWRALTDRLGIRLGDLCAETQVVDGKVWARGGAAVAPPEARLGAVAPAPPGSAAGALHRSRPAA